ncbi:MAG: hypothetical protein HY232_01115 [Acidobacteria bacterium]|nr:hypothetical protein [Acidobacteriota bacterium]
MKDFFPGDSSQGAPGSAGILPAKAIPGASRRSGWEPALPGREATTVLNRMANDSELVLQGLIHAS